MLASVNENWLGNFFFFMLVSTIVTDPYFFGKFYDESSCRKIRRQNLDRQNNLDKHAKEKIARSKLISAHQTDVHKHNNYSPFLPFSGAMTADRILVCIVVVLLILASVAGNLLVCLSVLLDRRLRQPPPTSSSWASPSPTCWSPCWSCPPPSWWSWPARGPSRPRPARPGYLPTCFSARAPYSRWLPSASVRMAISFIKFIIRHDSRDCSSVPQWWCMYMDCRYQSIAIRAVEYSMRDVSVLLLFALR